MEIIRLKNDWHFEIWSQWKHIFIEPHLDILTFYLHPEDMCMTIFNINFYLHKHRK